MAWRMEVLIFCWTEKKKRKKGGFIEFRTAMHSDLEPLNDGSHNAMAQKNNHSSLFSSIFIPNAKRSENSFFLLSFCICIQFSSFSFVSLRCVLLVKDFYKLAAIILYLITKPNARIIFRCFHGKVVEFFY